MYWVKSKSDCGLKPSKGSGMLPYIKQTEYIMALSSSNLQAGMVAQSVFMAARPMTAREWRMSQLEKILAPMCGKCKFHRNAGCPKSSLCKTRLVRTYPSPDSTSCDRYKPNYELQPSDEEYVYLKMHDNL
jgi:hypothetical protein